VSGTALPPFALRSALVILPAQVPRVKTG